MCKAEQVFEKMSFVPVGFAKAIMRKIKPTVLKKVTFKAPKMKYKSPKKIIYSAKPKASGISRAKEDAMMRIHNQRQYNIVT